MQPVAKVRPCQLLHPTRFFSLSVSCRSSHASTNSTPCTRVVSSCSRKISPTGACFVGAYLMISPTSILAFDALSYEWSRKGRPRPACGARTRVRTPSLLYQSRLLGVTGPRCRCHAWLVYICYFGLFVKAKYVAWSDECLTSAMHDRGLASCAARASSGASCVAAAWDHRAWPRCPRLTCRVGVR